MRPPHQAEDRIGQHYSREDGRVAVTPAKGRSWLRKVGEVSSLCAGQLLGIKKASKVAQPRLTFQVRPSSLVCSRHTHSDRYWIGMRT